MFICVDLVWSKNWKFNKRSDVVISVFFVFYSCFEMLYIKKSVSRLYKVDGSRKVILIDLNSVKKKVIDYINIGGLLG